MNAATRVRQRLGRTVLAALLVVACDGKGTTDPPTPAAITVSLAATTAEVTQAGDVTIPVIITRTNFNGAVTLTAEGLPTGVTAAPSTIAAGQTQGTLTLTAAANAAPATANITIRGSGSGVDPKTAALALTVRVRGNFTVSGPGAAVGVTQGASADIPLTINRTGGHSGDVTLTATAPAGITTAFTPATVTGTNTTSTLRVTVAGTVAPGNHTVTVTGNSAGLTAQTANITVSVAAPGSFTLGLNPATLSLAQGANGTAQVNITRTNNFAGDVTLTATAPAGITATFNPATTGGNASTLTIAVGAAVAVGNHTVTVRGNATGVAEQTATLTVQVAAPGAFTLSLTPANVAVQQGGSAQSTVNINRTGGLATSVALTATAPAGLTVTFNPASAPGNTSTMTVAAAANVAPGNYTVTVRGNVSGLAEQTASLAVTVNQGGQGGNVTWSFCPLSGIPVFVAYQDGTGPWTAAALSASNTVSFQISSGRGGVAYVSPAEGGGWDLDVFYGTTTELTQGNATCGGAVGAGKTVTATASGLGFGDFGWATLGAASDIKIGGQSTAITFEGVQDGLVDLVVSRLAIDPQTFNYSLTNLQIQRGLNPANNSSLGTINFAAGFAPASAQLTVTNLNGDSAIVGAFYMTQNRTFAPYYFDFAPSTAGTRPWYGFPPNQQAANELHVLSISATKLGNENRTRQVLLGSRDVANRTVSLGPDLSAATVSVAATQPYVRPRIAYNVQAEYNRDWTASFQQGNAAAFRTATVRATSGYTGGTGSITLEVPDLSGVAGWNNTWGLASGVQTTWVLTATGFTGNPSLTNPFSDGSIFYAGTAQGQFTP